MLQIVKYGVGLTFFVLTAAATAQDIMIAVPENSSTTGRSTYDWYATTQIGASLPNDDFTAFSDYGFRTMTGVELQQSTGLFYRAGYEITLLSFNTSRAENNYTIINEGNRSILGGYIDIGYRFFRKRSDVYLFAGFGPLILSGPATTVEPSGLTIITKSNAQLKGAFHGGLGYSFQLKPRLIPFIEVQYFSLSGRTMINNTLLDGINASIGCRVPLKRDHD